MRIIAFHSYKGGTGKTHLSANLATVLARKGHKTALLDLDFRGPNLQTLCGIESEITINDLLFDPDLRGQDLLVSFEDQYKIPLFAAFASTDFRKMSEIVRADKKQRQRSLKRILKLRDELSESGFDYTIIDTSPGVQMESIDGLVISDATCLVLKADDFDISGTKSMVAQLYSLLDSKNYVILNRVVAETCPPEHGVWSENDMKLVTKLKQNITDEMRMSVITSIPCFCEVAREGSRNIFSLQYPDHPFSQHIENLAMELIAGFSSE
ncbi:MAG: MinD/ParA family ATP-binding protein [Candidatus Hodarchaeales archaeon]|jgi:MinD-like ATPase involved in chromosome partitioning or flagellar assembly